MKQTKIQTVLKITFLMMLLISLILAGGCSAGADKDVAGDASVKEESQDQGNEEEPGFDGMTSFQTKDIYGNDINQDIFQNHKLTLVNVWGTYCGPCLDEMPYLGELQTEYASKGVNIVGIVIDVQDESLEILDDQIELAREISNQTGAGYTHMIISDEMFDTILNQFDAIPASFFVDSNGNIVSEFYIGSRSKDDWTGIIEENLENLK